ncbi:ABC transporter substrate-binding protein [Amylibacter sp. SFDW26]|uniref:ABC transporter substrate-binding protein n=1 Tax=Amylibacter sp. SFDW26 TaxID=2652722 RepID=UPI00126278AD|nr:ABC transporter substrate-binding protein [Amylibacter sp. SFDW26]KAB7613899.1 ABC transporter substrate-binding protein [Amylibacter sp. SFDW26]
MKYEMLAISALLLSTGVAFADETQYPLTIDNCGRSLTFNAAPERAVSIGQASTEMLYELGLAERVAGTAVWFTDVSPKYKAVNDKVERLADNTPSFESVLAKKPQLVTSQYEWYIGPEGSVGTHEQFEGFGIQSYTMPSDCIGKDNSTGGDGTRLESFSMDSIYQGITQFSTIFNVQSAGQAAMTSLQDRYNKAIEQAKALDAKDLSAVVWFSSPDQDSDAYVAGQKGVPGFMLKELGIRNVIETDEEWPIVGWETITKANPDIIVLARMDRRRRTMDDYKMKLEFLKNDPVASKLDAVVNDRIIIVDAHAIQPSIRIASGLETIVNAVQEFDIKK